MSLLDEDLMTLAELCRSEERFPLHTQKLLRWITHGLQSKDGFRIVRLEGMKIGNSWRTSREALCRFFAALTRAHLADASGVPAPRPTLSEATQRALDACLSD